MNHSHRPSLRLLWTQGSHCSPHLQSPMQALVVSDVYFQFLSKTMRNLSDKFEVTYKIQVQHKLYLL